MLSHLFEVYLVYLKLFELYSYWFSLSPRSPPTCPWQDYSLQTRTPWYPILVPHLSSAKRTLKICWPSIWRFSENVLWISSIFTALSLGKKMKRYEKTAEEELNNKPFLSQTEGLLVWVRSSISKIFSNLCSLKEFFSGRHEECEVWPPFSRRSCWKEHFMSIMTMFHKEFLALSQCTT